MANNKLAIIGGSGRYDVEEFKAMVHEEMKSIPLESFNFSYEIIDTLPFSKLSPKLVEELDGIMEKIRKN